MAREFTIRDIAREAGVSPMTVSRALSEKNGSKVSESVRAHILEVCARLKYRPNEYYRRLQSGRSDTVAFIFPILEYAGGGFEHYGDLSLSACIQGAQEYLAANNYDLLLIEENERFLRTDRWQKIVRGGLVDGVLLWGMTDFDTWVGRLSDENVSIVMLQTEIPMLDCFKVTVDEYGAMRRLVERAIAAGHRRFALPRSYAVTSLIAQRMGAVDDVLAENGITPVFQREYDYSSVFSYDSGSQFVEELNASGTDATCIIATFTQQTCGILDGIRKAGLKLPDDISLVAADVLEIPGMSARPSGYYIDYCKLGAEGARAVLAGIMGESCPNRITIQAEDRTGETLLNRIS